VPCGIWDDRRVAANISRGLALSRGGAFSSRCGNVCLALGFVAGRWSLMVCRTNKSSSTENTSASDRYSYQSTEPSSVESRSQEHLAYHNHKQSLLQNQHDQQDDEEDSSYDEDRSRSKHHFSLAAAGRAFSFGRPRPKEPSSSPPRENLDETVTGRGRSMTESSYASSASTAQPPRHNYGPSMADEAIVSPGSMGPSSSRSNPIMKESEAAHQSLPPIPPLPPQAAARSVGSTPLQFQNTH